MKTTNKYRYFIQADGKKEYAHKGYHYQATATSLNELWNKISAQMDHYARNVGDIALETGIRRSLKASAINGTPVAIGTTTDGKRVYVQRLSECKERDPFYYYRWIDKRDGGVLYSMQHMASPSLYSTDRYEITKITCEEYQTGIVANVA